MIKNEFGEIEYKSMVKRLLFFNDVVMYSCSLTLSLFLSFLSCLALVHYLFIDLKSSLENVGRVTVQTTVLLQPVQST